MASPRGSRTLRRGESVKDRSAYSLVHKASMRHRSIALDSNDADLMKLRLAYKSKPLDLQVRISKNYFFLIKKNFFQKIFFKSVLLAKHKKLSFLKIRNIISKKILFFSEFSLFSSNLKIISLLSISLKLS